MSNAHQHIDLIDRAILKELNAEEQVLFDEKILEPNFHRAYQIQLMMVNRIQEEGQVVWKEKLQIEERKFQIKSKSIKLYRWLLAASVLLGVGYLLIQQSSKDPMADLYVSYYQKLPNLVDPITKGAQDEYSPYQLYETERYGEALSAFKLLESTEDSQFYEALSNLESGNFEFSKSIFQSILKSPEHNYIEEAQWYLAMNLLMSKDRNSLLVLLDKIIEDENHFYRSKAIALKKDIEK